MNFWLNKFFWLRWLDVGVICLDVNSVLFLNKLCKIEFGKYLKEFWVYVLLIIYI